MRMEITESLRRFVIRRCYMLKDRDRLSGLEDLRQFVIKHNFMPNDPYLYDMYEYYLSARRDEASRLETAREMGKAEGREKALTASILGMMDNGISTDAIYNCVGEGSKVREIIERMKAAEAQSFVGPNDKRGREF